MKTVWTQFGLLGLLATTLAYSQEEAPEVGRPTSTYFTKIACDAIYQYEGSSDVSEKDQAACWSGTVVERLRVEQPTRGAVYTFVTRLAADATPSVCKLIVDNRARTPRVTLASDCVELPKASAQGCAAQAITASIKALYESTEGLTFSQRLLGSTTVDQVKPVISIRPTPVKKYSVALKDSGEFFHYVATLGQKCETLSVERIVAIPEPISGSEGMPKRLSAKNCKVTSVTEKNNLFEEGLTVDGDSDSTVVSLLVSEFEGAAQEVNIGQMHFSVKSHDGITAKFNKRSENWNITVVPDEGSYNLKLTFDPETRSGSIRVSPDMDEPFVSLAKFKCN